MIFFLLILNSPHSQSNENLTKQVKKLKSDLELLSASHLHGKFEPSILNDFATVDSQFCFKPSYLLREVYEAFLKMAEAAKKDSIELKIISATRTFDSQKLIWENKWRGKVKIDGQKLTTTYKNTLRRAYKILEYTAPPGFSRHHWGTEIDLNAVEDEFFNTPEGEKMYSWLRIHAGEFGFCQTYTPKDLRNGLGFNEEKWHWSYSRIADSLQSEMVRTFQKTMISDFLGFKEVRKINLLNDYILSIHTCQ